MTTGSSVFEGNVYLAQRLPLIMEPIQIVSLFGAIVLTFALLKAHHVVVKKHVLPSIEEDESVEE